MDELENTNNLINTAFDYIEFTMKQESNNKLSLLDVPIIRTDTEKLETQVYQNQQFKNSQNQLCTSFIQESENTLQHMQNRKMKNI